ncbi:hypothetical protein [Streptomyces sp. NPDC055036]
MHVSDTNLYTLCAGSDPTLASGSSGFEADLTVSCLNLFAAGPTQFTITWNNGQSSTIHASYAHTTDAGQIILRALTVTGNVTSGEFSGAAVLGQYTYLQPNLLQCLGNGITSQSGTGTLEILPA